MPKKSPRWFQGIKAGAGGYVDPGPEPKREYQGLGPHQQTLPEALWETRMAAKQARTVSNTPIPKITEPETWKKRRR